MNDRLNRSLFLRRQASCRSRYPDLSHRRSVLVPRSEHSPAMVTLTEFHEARSPLKIGPAGLISKMMCLNDYYSAIA